MEIVSAGDLSINPLKINKAMNGRLCGHVHVHVLYVSILFVVITKPCCLKGMSREDKAATNSSTRLLLPAALISDLKT